MGLQFQRGSQKGSLEGGFPEGARNAPLERTTPYLVDPNVANQWVEAFLAMFLVLFWRSHEKNIAEAHLCPAIATKYGQKGLDPLISEVWLEG